MRSGRDVVSLKDFLVNSSVKRLIAAGPHTIINGKNVVNFASANYLGLMGHEKLLDSCTSSLEKYGVGSCGPHQFYRTIDVHLDCETKIAEFLGTPDSILYSYGLSTMFSAIPAFCKKGDIIVVDEGVHWGIQNGLYLSRSTIVYFKHNDMQSLQSTLEKVTQDNKRAKKLRRYIVVEAVYQIQRLKGIIEGLVAEKEMEKAEKEREKAEKQKEKAEKEREKAEKEKSTKKIC
ncbi:hypothetical protein QVD17_36427 [Tagetes erecta]|uniref:serine C-palmitoyltransferase n=1 Tax=Tagetes erecta TaxID=13708 RepID=A0AAD8JU48_TARER|nr:hypothetical protein QVD17_36427 [Tagetes erecta]